MINSKKWVCRWTNSNDLVDKWEKILLFPFNHIVIVCWFVIIKIFDFPNIVNNFNNRSPLQSFDQISQNIFFCRKTKIQFKIDSSFCWCTFFGVWGQLFIATVTFLWQKKSCLQTSSERGKNCRKEIKLHETRLLWTQTTWSRLRSIFFSLVSLHSPLLVLLLSSSSSLPHKQQMYHIIFILHS